MSHDQTFAELISRFRAGDQNAAAELVRTYEPQVRRLIRVRLSDPQLVRILDSADIFQSVFAVFFVKIVEGWYDPKEPAEFIRLLTAMAYNKIVDHARKASRRRTVDMEMQVWDDLASSEDSPSSIVAMQELLQKVRRLLTAEERHLAEQRAEGRSWPEIAAECGGKPDALRKKVQKALARVRRQLGLQGQNNERSGGPDKD
jgi:RNA polymerase sigma-70 factor (ECF subfamily)